MRTRVLHLSARPETPAALRALVDEMPEGGLTRLATPAEVVQELDRGIVELLVIDGDDHFEEGLALCGRLKADPFNSVVPIVFLTTGADIGRIERAFESGVDEFLSKGHGQREQYLRMRMVLKRAARDVSVNPTTMLPGTRIIQHDIELRIASGERFAVCYADIDSFKEFNDKHSYHRGDRVIWIVSMILRDTVRRLSERGFVGHVGGDDFIFTLPVEDLEPVSRAILSAFDTLMPLQYTDEERSSGFILAEDRQGSVREIPLMTLSIGAVTNVRRDFTHPGRVSELASEMKTYAKTLKGSVFVVDRRSDATAEAEVAGPGDGGENRVS